MGAVTNTPIQVSYFIADIATALLTYNRLRWYRSTSETGTYEAITAALPEAASIDSTRTQVYDVVGKTLDLRVNGTTAVAVTFTGVGALTAAQVVAQIAAASVLLAAAVTTSNGVRVSTAQTGGDAGLEIVGGDAAAFLGFLVGTQATGKDQDTVLVAGTHEYFFTDQQSATTYWYRVEFRNSATSDVSGLGIAFPANKPQRVPASQTIVCYLRLCDMEGGPIPCRKVTFVNVFAPNRAGSNLEWGVFRHYAEKETDRNGYMEIRLLRGMVVDINIDGTGFTRRLQIPTTGDAVDLLDPGLVTQDEFGIQEPNIDFAIRLS